LINAITIDADSNLISGYRRLKAYEHLGWKQIEVNVVDTLESAASVLAMERDKDNERVPMNSYDILAYVSVLARLENGSSERRREAWAARRANGQFPGQPVGNRGKQPWEARGPLETRTVMGSAIGISPATTSRYLSIARKLNSKDPVKLRAAERARAELAEGSAVHPAYERMVIAIQSARDIPAPGPKSEMATSYRMRRRDEMVMAKFQRDIIGTALETGASLVDVLNHIADKLNTYGVNKDITPAETGRWLRDITRTRVALGKVSTAIKGGQTNGNID